MRLGTREPARGRPPAPDLHVLPPGAAARRARRADPAHARRPDDAGDRPGIPRPRGDARPAPRAGEEEDPRRPGSRTACRPTSCCPSGSTASWRCSTSSSTRATARSRRAARPARALREAIRLARLVAELLPDQPETDGLLALLLLQDSRRDARVGDRTAPWSLLEDQDRGALGSRRDRRRAGRVGARLCGRSRDWAMRPGRTCSRRRSPPVHARALRRTTTDWRVIAALYEALARVDASPVVELNRAVAVAHGRRSRGGPRSARRAGRERRPRRLPPLPAARADLLRRLGRRPEAAARTSGPWISPARTPSGPSCPATGRGARGRLRGTAHAPPPQGQVNSPLASRPSTRRTDERAAPQVRGDDDRDGCSWVITNCPPPWRQVTVAAPLVKVPPPDAGLASGLPCGSAPATSPKYSGPLRSPMFTASHASSAPRLHQPFVQAALSGASSRAAASPPVKVAAGAGVSVAPGPGRRRGRRAARAQPDREQAGNQAPNEMGVRPPRGARGGCRSVHEVA